MVSINFLRQMKPLRLPCRRSSGDVTAPDTVTRSRRKTYGRPNEFPVRPLRKRANPHGYWLARDTRVAASRVADASAAHGDDKLRCGVRAANQAERWTNRRAKFFREVRDFAPNTSVERHGGAHRVA